MSKQYKLYVPLDQRAPVTLTPEDVVRMYHSGWAIDTIVRVVVGSKVFTRKQYAREYVYKCIYRTGLEVQRMFT